MAFRCGREEKQIKDIVLLKSIGVIPIVVHRTQMGVDKFRENKCIIRVVRYKRNRYLWSRDETIQMMIKNDYIPGYCAE